MFRDFERCYRAVESRDARFDGMFFTAVTSTGIYCRPSCPALTPKRKNVTFFATAAAAHGAGFRACKRCRPDASPGSPEWNVRADIVGRAMRLIHDGVVDREGVAGLARRLHVGERHLHRVMIEQVGAGPQALARAQRAQTARVLIETTPLPFTEVAFAAGFASIRQFNDTVRAVFAATPSELRRKREAPSEANGHVSLRLPFRPPFDRRIIDFLGSRTIEGVENVDGNTYRRTLSLAHGPGIVELTPHNDHIACRLWLKDLRDLTSAVDRSRRLLDLDADPDAVAGTLRRDPVLKDRGPFKKGTRLPGTVDGFEIAARAILGQQVSVAAARKLASRLVGLCGDVLAQPDHGLTHRFPTPRRVVAADLGGMGVPSRRLATLKSVALRAAEGRLDLDAGADRTELQRSLVEIPGVGPWTASYIAMRLGDPDVFLSDDLGVKRALGSSSPVESEELAANWSPWRSYAVLHLWNSTTRNGKEPAKRRSAS